jgi:ubiquinone/menaquinone biosynthesis C-methylase UbiE
MDVAYIFLAVLILVMYTVTLWGSVEGFDGGAERVSDVSTFEDDDAYDDMYASIYDQLWHSDEKLNYERVSIQDIALADKKTTSVKVLDMCCGTAPHACWFKNMGVGYVGVDKSDAMIRKARNKCSVATFQNGDITQVQLFPPKSFSHAMLLNFSCYMFENPKILSDNAFHWLKHDGWFVVHMVDPDKFDPVLDLATPFAAFSLQKYSPSRKTDSEIYFDKFKYTGRFNKKAGNETTTFTELFKDYTAEGYREHKHHWNMPEKERLINVIQSSGFRHVETVNLVRCGKEYQYLVYFTK